jgi:hypothetical protein
VFLFRIYRRKKAEMQKGNVEWINANVHAWSGQMSAVLSADMPDLVQESIAASARSNPAAIKQSLLPQVRHVVDKILGRRDARDNDLCGVNPLGLLQIAWEETSRDADGDSALSELMFDIGGTCLQGDTHRLFFYIRAIRLSKQPI